MASILNSVALKAQHRNKSVIEHLVCECFFTVRGVLCQGADSQSPSVGSRCTLEVEDSRYGHSLVIKSLIGEVIGRVKAEEAANLLPFSWSQ